MADELAAEDTNTPLERPPTADGDEKRPKGKARFLLGMLGLWVAVGLLLSLIPSHKEEFNVSIFAPQVDVLGYGISQSVLISWLVLAILLVAGILVRVLVIPRFTETPRGLQNILETVVEAVSGYTSSQTGGHLGDNLSAYILSIGAFMVTCAVLELFGLRAPTSDLVMTGSLALCTFFITNYYGLKVKGLKGRLKAIAAPPIFIVPFRILSDLSGPISLASRLFGNMLGGMIVVELIYMALGSFGAGIPAVLGLYFNVFHPLIQAFIFITLSLTFIREATE